MLLFTFFWNILKICFVEYVVINQMPKSLSQLITYKVKKTWHFCSADYTKKLPDLIVYTCSHYFFGVCSHRETLEFLMGLVSLQGDLILVITLTNIKLFMYFFLSGTCYNHVKEQLPVSTEMAWGQSVLQLWSKRKLNLWWFVNVGPKIST